MNPDENIVAFAQKKQINPVDIAALEQSLINNTTAMPPTLDDQLAAIADVIATLTLQQQNYLATVYQQHPELG